MRAAVTAWALASSWVASSAVAQSLIVGPELPLLDLAEGPVEGGVVFASSGSAQVLVTWTDYGHDPGGDILGRLIADDGTTIEVPLSDSPLSEVGGPTAFDGSRYLVVWYQGWSNGHPDKWVSAFVTPEGDVTAPFDLVTNPPVVLTYLPRLAYGSGVYLVAYGAYEDDNNVIDGLLVDTLGDVTPIGRLATMAGGYDVASDGTSFLLTWEDFFYDAAAYQLLDGTGQAASAVHYPHLETELLQVSDGSTSVTFAGDKYVVGFNGAVFDGAEWGPLSIFAVRVDTDGALLDTEAAVLASGGPIGAVDAFAVGDDAVFLWVDCCSPDQPRPLVGGRLQGDGAVLDPGGVALSEETPVDSWVYAGVAQNGGVRLFYRAPAAPGAFVSRTLWQRGAGADLTPDSATWLNSAPVPQASVVYLPGSPVSLVVSRDLRSGDAQLYAGRLDGAGARLDGAGVIISPSTNQQLEVSVAGPPSAALAVWQESAPGYQYTLRAAWISATDAELSFTTFDLVSQGSLVAHPRVLFDGTRYFVTWIDTRGGAAQVVDVLLDAMDATPDPTPQPLTSGSTVTLWGPQPALTDGGFAVAYRDSGLGGPALYLVRADADGAPLAEAPLFIAASSSYDDDAVTSAGSELWVSYASPTGWKLAHVPQSPFAVTAIETLVAGAVVGRLVAAADGSLLATWAHVGAPGAVFAAQRCPDGGGPLEAIAVSPSSGVGRVALAQDVGLQLLPTASGALVTYASTETAPAHRAVARHLVAGTCGSCCESDGGDPGGGDGDGDGDSADPGDEGDGGDAGGDCDCFGDGDATGGDGGSGDADAGGGADGDGSASRSDEDQDRHARLSRGCGCHGGDAGTGVLLLAVLSLAARRRARR